MNLEFKNKMHYSHPCIQTFIVLQKTECFSQSHGILQPSNKYVCIGDLYDAFLIYKNTNYYLDLGYNSKLGCNLFIPVFSQNTKLNVENYLHYIKKPTHKK